MAQTILLMCWLTIAGMPTTGTAPLPDELLTEHTVAIHRLDLTNVEPADAQSTVAYLLQRMLDSDTAKRVEAIPKAITQFRQAGGREIVIIGDTLPDVPGEGQGQRAGGMLAVLQQGEGSEEGIADAVHSLSPWLLPSEFEPSRTRRIGSWLVLSETARIAQTKRSASRQALLQEALSVRTGAPISSIVLPNTDPSLKPPDSASLLPLIHFMPEAILAFIWYPHDRPRPEELWAHIRWMATEATFGTPPTVSLAVSVRDDATREELVGLFKAFGVELKLVKRRPTGAFSTTSASTLPAEASRDDAILQARIAPSPILAPDVGAHWERPWPQRPAYEAHLAYGHFREATIRKGPRQYRLSLYSAPRYDVREPQFYSKLRILEEPTATQPAEPIYREPGQLAGVFSDTTVHRVPFAVGTVRYDPAADEILLVERPELGNGRQILRHMYRVIWQTRKYQAPDDRFSQEAETIRVLQSDERLTNWDFANAPLRIDISPPGIRRRTNYYYSTTQPGESEFPLPGTGRSEGRGRR